MFKSRCYNGGNRHKFTPRYTTESKPGGEIESGRTSTKVALELIKACSHTKTIYHGDVCEWCGKVVNEKTAG